jgi:hypothetical protein
MRERRYSKLRGSEILRRLCFESLESRRAMASNVTAEVIDGDLIITGDDASSTIGLRQSGSGNFVVESVGGPRPYEYLVLPSFNPTTVNGEFREALFEGVTGDIVIRAGGGDDRVVIRNVDSFGGLTSVIPSFAAPGDLIIDGGAGYDTIDVGELIQSNVVMTFAGLDLIEPPSLTIGGNLQIDASDDGGSIHVSPGAITGALQIATASRADQQTNTIRIAGVNAASCSINGSDTVELVLIASLRTSGPFAIATGSGNDDVQIHALDLGGDASVDLGAGTDRAFATGAAHGNLVVQGATGNDSLILGGEPLPGPITTGGNPFLIPAMAIPADPVRRMEVGAGGPLVVERDLTVETGGGDYLNLQHSQVAGRVRINSGMTDTPEFIRLRSIAAQEISISSGGGDDVLDIGYSTAQLMLNANLGDGDDALSMHVVAYNNSTILNEDFIIAAAFNGGDGRDILAFDGCRFDGLAAFVGGNGDDQLRLNRSVVNRSSVRMGGGADNVEIGYSAISHLSAATGADNDQVTVSICAVDEAFFILGEGSDWLEISGCILGGVSEADGSASFDTLNRRHSRIRQFNATNFEAGSDVGLLFT